MLTTRTKIAIARMIQGPLMAARRLIGRGPAARVRRRGIDWDLDLKEGIDFAIYLMGAFDGDTIKAYAKYLRPGMTVLDIGANIGAHTLHLARLAGPKGRVFAFEPTDWAYAKLCANLKLNPDLAARVTAVQAFLVNQVEPGAIGPIPSSWPLDGKDVHPNLRSRAMPAKGAKPTRLDDFLKAAKVERVDLVKIDVDGFECQVLAGAMGMLKRDQPMLIMEFSPYVLEERGFTLNDMLDLLDQAGYRLERLSSGAVLPEDRETLATLVPVGAGFNVLARPHA